jgi:hypothetical protein
MRSAVEGMLILEGGKNRDNLADKMEITVIEALKVIFFSV